MPDKDSVPNPPDAESTTSSKEFDSPPSDQLQSLRNDLYELKERILTLREGELLGLKEKHLQLYRVATIFLFAGFVVTALTYIGFKQFGDIDALIAKKINDKIETRFPDFERRLGRYEKLTKAASLISILNNFPEAERILRELHSESPDEEIAFLLLLHCLAQQNAFAEGYNLIDEAKRKNDFPRHFHMLWTLNNAGYILLIKGLDQPELLPDAFTLLQQAEHTGLNDRDQNVAYPLSNLMLYYVISGDMTQAKARAVQWHEIFNTEKWKPPISEQWLQKLEKIRPSARSDLETLSTLTAPHPSPGKPDD
jgi:hypothetical protein